MILRENYKIKKFYVLSWIFDDILYINCNILYINMKFMLKKFKRAQKNPFLLRSMILSWLFLPIIWAVLWYFIWYVTWLEILSRAFFIGFFIISIPLSIIWLILLFKNTWDIKEYEPSTIWDWIKNVAFIALCIWVGVLISDESITRDSIPSRVYIIWGIVLAIVILLWIIYLIVRFIKRSWKH